MKHRIRVINHKIYTTYSLLRGRVLLKPGLSFVIRARNEEENIENCLLSIVEIADEIIFVDHMSTDNTYDIAKSISERFTNIKLYKYKYDIPRAGYEHQSAVRKGNKKTLADYYNFCFKKATKYNVVKWDADFIGNRKNLKLLIDKLNLKNRSDHTCIKFDGQTLFVDSNGDQYLRCDQTIYVEYRIFSLLHGIRWINTPDGNCEMPHNMYLYLAKKKHFPFPCFYEIKRVEKNEFNFRSNLIDNRDIEDNRIIEELRRGHIPKAVSKMKIL